MNNKPFDLEKALAGEKVVTRNGRVVTQIFKFEAYNERDTLYAVIEGNIWKFKTNGNYEEIAECGIDLFMAPVTVERWININCNDKNDLWMDTGVYLSEEDAKKGCHIELYKTINIQIDL